MAYYNNFFWKKAKEADIVIYNDKQVAFLLNQFGLKIERYSWNGSIYVVVLK